MKLQTNSDDKFLDYFPAIMSVVRRQMSIEDGFTGKYVFGFIIVIIKQRK